MVSDIKQKFIVDFFTALEQKNTYCILRNYEELPEHVGDDIDMLLEGDDSVVDNIVVPIIKELGWDYLIKFRKKGFTPIVCMYTTNSTVDTCQLDIYTSFLWRGNRFADEKAVLKSRYRYGRFWAADHGADLAITIAKELMGSEKVREKYRVKMKPFATEGKDSFYAVLIPVYGSLTDEMYSAIINSRFLDIDAFAKPWKNAVRKQSVSTYLSNSYKSYVERVAHWLKPEGKLIAFVGPDGSGKTTLISKEDAYLERFFPHNSKIFHRRYEIFPELKTGHGFSSMKGAIKSGNSNLDLNP